ncbi:MAG TPA: hypothetical protein VGI30_05720 [Caulobacteraceae bacterium]|jgi:hypothetical protein
MTDRPEDTSFRRVAGLAAMLSLPLALGSAIMSLAAVKFDVHAFSQPLLLLHSGAAGADLWRWSMFLDLFGYYLLIVPLILSLRTQLRPLSHSWIDLFAVCLVAYTLVGASGAAMLAMAVPPLVQAYGDAGTAQRAILEAVFSAQSNDVYRGLWNALEELLAGIGWVGMGLYLRRQQRGMGVVTIVLGLACLFDSAGSMLNLGVSDAGLDVYLVLAPIWAFWLGLDRLRTPASPSAE